MGEEESPFQHGFISSVVNERLKNWALKCSLLSILRYSIEKISPLAHIGPFHIGY